MTDDDFRAAMSDVAPLKADVQKKAAHREQQLDAEREMPRAVSLTQLERRYAALGINRTPTVDPNPLTLGEVPLVEPREVLEWKKDGVQNEVFARLRNGQYPIEGSLDLHRLSVKEARQAVFKFFHLADAKRWRTILIAHGRGEQSATPARLKSFVKHWLDQLPQVIAYSSADRRHGGTGAVLVLLKKSAAAKEETREAYGLKSDPDEDDR
ncbi:MAG: DNA endonuclease SmrA [Pseudomonadota bacterium]